MSIWSLAAAAILAGTVAGVPGQNTPGADRTPPAPTVQVQAQQRVSLNFNHASVGEVMDWLSKNGASFVAADSELPKDATITLNIKDEPINQVMGAIADALGGHWERRGGVRVFHKGEGFRVFGDNDDAVSFGDEPGANFDNAPEGSAKTFQFLPKDGSVKAFGMVPGKNGKGFTFVPGNGQMKVFGDGQGVFMSPDMKVLAPNMDEFREQLKGLPDNEEIRKEVEAAMKAARESMQANGETLKISRKAMEQARKAMEKARKEHPEAFNGKSFYFSDGDSMKISQKAMEEAEKAMEKAQNEHPEALNGKIFMSPDDSNKFFQYRVAPGAPGDNRFRTFRPSMRIDGQGFTKLMESLSPDQRELNRRQGFLRAHDLTESQRKMLGISGRDKGWTIKISKDGDEVTIKSDN